MFQRASVCLAAALWALTGNTATAIPSLVGVQWQYRNPTSELLDIDAATGAATNLRVIDFNRIHGIDVTPDGTAYVMRTNSGTLYTLDLATGQVASVGDTGITFGSESDLTYDTTTDRIYVFNSADNNLWSVDPASGASLPVGTIAGAGDLSGLAVNNNGDLYGLKTNGPQQLLRIDKSDGAVLGSVTVTEPMGALAGMDFDSSGQLWVVDGTYLGGSGALRRIDPLTGEVHMVGLLVGATADLSGLAVLPVVPEPGTGVLIVIALIVSAVVRRR